MTNCVREDEAQMRIELGMGLKHITGCVEKVNVVNYLSKISPPNDGYYYEED